MPPRKPETINTIRNRTEKTCSSCGVCKSLCEFGKDKGMLDGRYSHCKLCRITRSHEDYKKRKDKIQKYSTAYRKTERGKMARKKESETQKKKINYKANYTVTNAVRDGRIKKPHNCSLCNAEGVLHGHHYDYTKPLEVVWVCVQCHNRIHKEEKHLIVYG